MPNLPSRGRLKRFVIILGLMEAFALSVFFAFVLGLAYANGGTIHLEMRTFGEHHFEYWLMVVLVPTISLGMFYTLENLPTADQIK